MSHPLRQNARGKMCTLRLSCCNGNPETTVLAHYRRFGWGGMGLKPHDILGCFACSACHDAIDGRRNDVTVSDSDLLRAMGETLKIQLLDGILSVS